MDSFVRKLVIEAGRAIQALSDDRDVIEKTPNDFVTGADRRAAGLIIDQVRQAFPHDTILCEDAERAPSASNGERIWLVDPLDGTTNFLHHYPFYAVSIGVYEQRTQRPVVSAVFAPALDQLFEAYGDEPPRLNGRPIKVSSVRELHQALVLTGFSHRVRTESNELTLFAAISAGSSGTRRSGCAALDICYVAAGFADAYYHMNLEAWDMAAAAHILGNAGGRTTNIGVMEFNLFHSSVLATNGVCHDAVQQALADGLGGRRGVPVGVSTKVPGV